MSSFLIGDLHFSHKNIVVFQDSTGKQIRPHGTVEAHDEAIVDNWNSIVCPGDTVYVLGDVVIPKRGLDHVQRLNGRKILVAGNHDMFPAAKMLEIGFADIRAYKEFEKHGWICSHIPLHTSQLDHRWKVNIHGHLHNNFINDPRYLCLSAEQVNFTPFPLDMVEERVRMNKESFEANGNVINWSNP